MGHVSQLFDAADANDDGMVHYAEFAAWLLGENASNVGRILADAASTCPSAAPSDPCSPKRSSVSAAPSEPCSPKRSSVSCTPKPSRKSQHGQMPPRGKLQPSSLSAQPWSSDSVLPQ